MFTTDISSFFTDREKTNEQRPKLETYVQKRKLSGYEEGEEQVR